MPTGRQAERAADRLNEVYLERRATGTAGPGSLIEGGAVKAEGFFGTGAVGGPFRAHHGSVCREARMELEQALKAGRLPALVGTSYLELGIDIGSLGAALIIGYPGSIAATWQQAGRSGRGEKSSLAVLVASPNPLDQYLARHPDYFFNQSPEYGMINPENLLILLGHIRCAAFALPFQEGETFGSINQSMMAEIMDYLQAEGVIHPSGNKFFWMTWMGQVTGRPPSAAPCA